MPNITVSQDIDSFIKSVDNLSARTSLGLGTAATGFTHDFNSIGPALAGNIPMYGPEDGMITIGTSDVINGVLRYATGGGEVSTYFASETFNYIPSYGTGCGSLQIHFPPGGPTPSNMRLLANGNTAPRDYTFPNASGTFTLTSELSAYVPITRTVNGQSLSANITISTGAIPISGITGLGAGVATALALSANTANGFVRRGAVGEIASTDTNAFISTSGTDAFISTTGTNAFISTTGTNAFISTSGANAGISTRGALAPIYTTGALAGIYTTGANAPIYTTGANAPIYTTGASGIIWTSGSDASIYTLGANAFIAADGVNSFIQSRGTYKLYNGTFITTLSHIPTAHRTITFPNASGIVRLVETPVTLGSLSGAVTFNRDSGLFQNATVTSSLTANISGGSDWNSLDLWLTALSGADRTLDLNAAIQKPSDSAISFPVTITSGKGCRVKFEKHGSTWMLVSLVKSYTL